MNSLNTFILVKSPKPRKVFEDCCFKDCGHYIQLNECIRFLKSTLVKGPFGYLDDLIVLLYNIHGPKLMEPTYCTYKWTPWRLKSWWTCCNLVVTWMVKPWMGIISWFLLVLHLLPHGGCTWFPSYNRFSQFVPNYHLTKIDGLAIFMIYLHARKTCMSWYGTCLLLEDFWHDILPCDSCHYLMLFKIMQWTKRTDR